MKRLDHRKKQRAHPVNLILQQRPLCNVAESNSDFDLGIELGERATGDRCKPQQFPGALASRAFGDIARNRNGRAPHLLREAVCLCLREGVGDFVNVLNEFDRQVRAVVDVLDVEHMLRRLLDETLQCVRCTGGAVLLAKDGELQLVHASTGWEGPTVLELQMNHDDTCIGWLVLGTRRNGIAYSEQECKRLQQSADKVAHAVVLLMAEDRVIRTQPCPPNISVSWPPAPANESTKAD